jgi:DNA-binding transcriptional LysR family regulator
MPERDHAAESARVRRRVRLRDLETFAAVVRAGGMRKAAGALNLSQPAISRAVLELEQVFGVPLLQRSRRGVEPTEFGLALMRRAGAMMDELESTVGELAGLADPGHGTVRMGGGETIQAGLFTALIERLLVRYPRMRIEAESAQAGPLIEHLLPSRLIDFAVVRPLRLPLPPDLDAIALLRERMVVGVGHAHPLARRRKLDLEELAQQHWILSGNESMPESPLLRALAAQGLPAPGRVLVSGSLQTRLSLLPTGRFVTLFPHTIFPFGDFATRIKVLRVELPRWTVPTMVIRLKDRNPAPAAAKALEMLLEMGKALDEE